MIWRSIWREAQWLFKGLTIFFWWKIIWIFLNFFFISKIFTFKLFAVYLIFILSHFMFCIWKLQLYLSFHVKHLYLMFTAIEFFFIYCPSPDFVHFPIYLFFSQLKPNFVLFFLKIEMNKFMFFTVCFLFSFRLSFLFLFDFY